MAISRSRMASISNDAMLASLRQAVAHALERKRRLGPYAVVWRQGQPVIVEGHLLPSMDTTSAILREDASPVPGLESRTDFGPW